MYWFVFFHKKALIFCQIPQSYVLRWLCRFVSLQNFDFKRDVSHITLKSCRCFVCWISASKLLAMPRIMPTGLLVSNSAHKLFNTSKAQTFQLKGREEKLIFDRRALGFFWFWHIKTKTDLLAESAALYQEWKQTFFFKFSFPNLWWRICYCLTNSRSETQCHVGVGSCKWTAS